MFATLSYHQLMADFFRRHQETWRFFANHTHKEEQLKEFKTNLLKNTYKFDPTAEADLYAKVELAKSKLGIQVPVTLYQALNTEETNASIIYIGGEAHVVFSGKIIQTLSDDELLAIIGHELSHVHLYQQLNGDLETADRIITAIANHPGATPAHYESARLFKLYTEIFCDRGAATVAGSYIPVVAALVKTATGLQTVNADSYIKQAEEIFVHEGGLKTAGVSHPENFIRARAIWLWCTKAEKTDDTIRQMIEGPAGLDDLDLFRQQQLSLFTRQLLQLLLQPAWMQTEPVIALGKQYFAQFQWNEAPDTNALAEAFGQLHDSAKEYLAYVLYDVATADKSLEDVPLGFCFHLAGRLQLDTAFETVVRKERKLTDKKARSLKQQSLAEYQKENEHHHISA